MNFDDLQNAWGKQRVAGASSVPADVRRRLEMEVRQRSRKILRVIGVASFVFVVAGATAIAAHVTGILPFTPVSLATLLLVIGFDVVFLVGGIRAYRRMKHEAAGMGATLLAAKRSSLRAVEWQMRDCVLFGYAVILALVVQVAISGVRYWLGDVQGEVALANCGFTVLVVLAVALTLRRYYRRDLVPRRDELARELAELDGG